MKRIVFAFAGCLATLMSVAQLADSTQLKQFTNLYRRAVQYNDYNSAAYALTGMLEHGADKQYEDTLAVVYYRAGNPAGAYKLAGEVHTRNPKSVAALTLLAEISARTNEVKTSLDWYEKLVVLDPSPYNTYQLASRQFLLDRRSECRSSLLEVTKDSAAASKLGVTMEIGNGMTENVPVYAAACNMMGALAYKDKNLDQAGIWYRKAVAAFPEFAIAAENLRLLETEQKGKAPATKPAPKPKQ